MKIEGNKITAEEGYELVRTIDNFNVGTERHLGYSYYINGTLQSPPVLETPEMFKEVKIVLPDQEPEPVEPEEPVDWEIEHPNVPYFVTNRQLRLQLIKEEISLDEVDMAILQLPQPDRDIAKINWNFAGTFERTNSLLIQLAHVFEITEKELDRIFIEAKKL